MKKTIRYDVNEKTVEKEVNYIPFRYILAVLITLVHHFENGVWMYDCDSIKDLKTDMEDTLRKSIEVTPKMLKTNLLQRFIRAVVRIFAPML